MMKLLTRLATDLEWLECAVLLHIAAPRLASDIKRFLGVLSHVAKSAEGFSTFNFRDDVQIFRFSLPSHVALPLGHWRDYSDLRSCPVMSSGIRFPTQFSMYQQHV